MSDRKGRIKLQNEIVDKIISDLKQTAKVYNSQQGMVVKFGDVERILAKYRKDKD